MVALETVEGANLRPLNGYDSTLTLYFMNDILVFDDFYEDPYKVREFASSLNYDLSAPTSWNLNSEDTLWKGRASTTTYLEKGIDAKVSKLLGFVVRSGGNSGFFRLSKSSDTSDYFAHTDGLPANKRIYAGIVYLSLPEHCENKIGTLFFKHKKTGKSKIETTVDYTTTLFDLKNKDAWDVYKEIPLKFNRLVLLEINLFHAIGDVFGDSIENARLAQILSFHEI